MYQNYAAFIFDMDGTLVDSGQLHENAWIETLTQYQIPLEAKLMRSLAGVPTKQTIEILIKHFSVKVSASLDEINNYKEQIVRSTIVDYVKPSPLAELVYQYQGQKPMAVGTGAYTEEASLILKSCQLFELIDYVVGADQVKNPKPAGDTFLRCADLMSMNAAQCLVFEDAPAGLEAAKNAGMDVVDVVKSLNIHNDYFLEK